jgi:tripartite-type tricarboxylate transporter receptor subunit TctC
LRLTVLKNLILMRLFLCMAWAGAALLAAASAMAQDFPSRPLRLIVPFAPGGNVDITARAISVGLSEALGQQVVVENRPGGGGMVGTSTVAKATPDGYWLVLGSSSSITIAPALSKAPSYDPTRDLIAVGALHSVPIVLTTNAKNGAASFAEVLAQAKAQPGKLTVASAGVGSSNHLALELWMKQSGLSMVHVPYKGSGPAITDLLGGQVNLMMDQLTASLPHIKDGRLRALAVTSRARSPLLPSVPSLAELGVPDFEVLTFTGLFTTAGVPAAVLEKLEAALRRTLAQASVRERFANLGVDMIESDRKTFEAFVKRDFDNWRNVARDAKISLE